jgi:ABC-type nitrate/sulfonate/bicarbonate transport system substrate-binding protein
MIRSTCWRVAFAVAAAWVLSACAPAAPPAPPPTAAPIAASTSGQLTTVKLGMPVVPTNTTVQQYFAGELGYYKQLGLDVQITEYQGSPTALRALLSKEVDIIRIGGTNPYDAKAAGAPIKIISSPTAKGTDELVTNQSVSSFADMAGKRWAISAPEGYDYTIAKAIARQHGIDPASITFVAISDPAARVQALEAGQVDMTAQTNLTLKPVIDGLASGKFKILTTFAEEFPDLPLAYDVTRDDVIADRPQVLVQFLEGEIMGLRWAQKNPEQAANLALKFMKSTDSDLMLQGMKRMSSMNVMGLDGGISDAEIVKTQQELLDLGVVKSVYPANEIAASQFAQQAVKELGPYQP